MKQKLIFLITICLLPLAMSALTTKELAISINLAGKQRMLTQKMTKEALLVKSGIEKKQNLEKLKKTRDLFDKTLKGLIQSDKSLKLKACKDEKVQKQLQRVLKLWKEFDSNIQKVIAANATDKVYQDIEKQNLILLKEMNKAVTLYVSQSKQKTSKRAQAINLSGKERMLTQKMAKDLLLISQKIDSKKNKQDLKKTANLFEKILHGLQKGDQKLGLEGTKLPAIQKQLHKGEKLWKEIHPMFKRALKDKKVLHQTINQLDTLLVEMNKAVKKFEKSIAREKRALQLSALVNQFMQKKNIENHIINLAGKQRMLTQKICKQALLVSLNIDKAENKEGLQKSYKLYDKTLNGFVKGDKTLNLPASKNPKIISYVKVIRKEWQPFVKSVKKVISSNKKESSSLSYIVSCNESLLKKSNQLVQLFKKSGAKKSFLEKARLNIVDIAGRQRMLTQKMTKEKLLILAKVNIKDNSKKLHKSISMFDNSLKALIGGDKSLKIPKPSNTNIKKQLKKVEGLWERLKPIYLKDQINKQELQTIVKENPILLKEMNKAVHLSEIAIDY